MFNLSKAVYVFKSIIISPFKIFLLLDYLMQSYRLNGETTKNEDFGN